MVGGGHRAAGENLGRVVQRRHKVFLRRLIHRLDIAIFVYHRLAHHQNPQPFGAVQQVQQRLFLTRVAHTVDEGPYIRREGTEMAIDQLGGRKGDVVGEDNLAAVFFDQSPLDINFSAYIVLGPDIVGP